MTGRAEPARLMHAHFSPRQPKPAEKMLKHYKLPLALERLGQLRAQGTSALTRKTVSEHARQRGPPLQDRLSRAVQQRGPIRPAPPAPRGWP